MSDDMQQYSIPNQQAGILQYAESHGFVVVRSYADAGKTGVEAKHRYALQQLLRDVSTGQADYKAILVYDVTRWGRFPNSDEAAYYEFTCFLRGIPIHYCAEPFSNDGSMLSALMKSLKRAMAAEFSRELGEKVFQGKSRLARMGFWMGGQCGYGFRRLMVSKDRVAKQLLGYGEYKSLTTDRVILVPGPPEERRIIRRIFELAGTGIGALTIARRLNEQGLLKPGNKPWDHQTIAKIVRDPKYMGCNAWCKSTRKLSGPTKRVPREQWILCPRAFAPLVNRQTFERAQTGLPGVKIWTDRQILVKMQRLLRTKGRLSETIINEAHGVPSTVTLRKRFGSFRNLYDMLGFRMGQKFIHKNAQCERSMTLREDLANKLAAMFPSHVSVMNLATGNHWKRAALNVDGSCTVSLILCRSQIREGKQTWKWEIRDAERGNISLLCKMNARHDGVKEYYLVPDMFRSRHWTIGCSRFTRSVRLKNLSEFYTAVRKMFTSKTGNPTRPRRASWKT
jgi:DNA invertase Pin-like site-specific DNA recombinase